MELVAILRILWDRRFVVGLGVLLAVVVGTRADKGPPASGGAVSSLSMILDTTDSQLVAAAPYGAYQLPTRAALLSDALTTDRSVRAIARYARVPDGQISVLGPSARQIPQVDTPLVSQVYAVASTATAPYAVTVLADEVTPIIKIEAQAPNGRQAANLVRASASTLRSLLVREDGGDRRRGLVLDTVVPLHIKPAPATSTHRRLFMIGAALAALGAWCICVVLGTATARRMRRRQRSPRPG